MSLPQSMRFASAVAGVLWSLSGWAGTVAPLARAAADTPPNYPSSPYHGARDGDGRVIPCRCRARGLDFRLGDLVCMQTAVGTVLARCDLQENNTSWIPTATPCELSSVSPWRRWHVARHTVATSAPRP